jgi:hypothetical protein
MDLQKIGNWAFILGVIVAIIAGVFASQVVAYAGLIGLFLVILGIIVGLLNIEDKEIMPFLIAVIALVVVGNVRAFEVLNEVIAGLGTIIYAIVANIALFAAPAAVIVALVSVKNLAGTPKSNP